MQYGQLCCLQSSCGMHTGPVCSCFPHPLNDLWCQTKFLCLQTYCGVPWMTAPTKKWFQFLCLLIEGTSPRLLTSGFDTEFCWIRCCCEGTGLACQGYSLDSLIKPVMQSIMCCFASECGCADGKFLGCFLHPIDEPWCQEKFCCLQTYCGISPCLAEPFQLCCFTLKLGKGQAFDHVD